MPVRAMSFSYCGQLIAIASSEEKFIDISSVDSGDSLYSLPVSWAVDTLAWHPSKYILAYAGDDGGSKSSSSSSRSASGSGDGGSVVDLVFKC
ncbi:hypothetical protein HK100_000329 [Physocladia obscura]|uniref:Uncharacterized protein n=1 Tax=Physocladia obscura TaxID=109957 RepID=A0AAD5XFP1_9FUNG|nr:hypothetical protein HK100_000329 [Physocladia obscura]